LQHIWYINKKWTTEDTNPPEASISNGPLGVTGWDDTSVRMFYPVEGKIQELVWENLNRKWSIGDMQADIYD
jgi:hypothetical protein